MKAGSLPDDDAVALRECRASPSSGEVCLEVASTPRGLPARGPRSSRYVSLCLHLFFSITNFSLARVAEQQKHPTVNRASSDFVGASPTACTKIFFRDVG